MAIPRVASVYIEQCTAADKKFYPSQKTLNSFEKLQARLLDAGIDSRTYVESSVKIWDYWTRKRGLDIVPVNVLCGSMAFNRFMQTDPPSLRDQSVGDLVHYVHGATEYLFHALINGESLHEAEQHLENNWYPENWEKTVIQNTEKIGKIQRDVVRTLADTYRIAIEFEEVSDLAQQYLKRRKL